MTGKIKIVDEPTVHRCRQCIGQLGTLKPRATKTTSPGQKGQRSGKHRSSWLKCYVKKSRSALTSKSISTGVPSAPARIYIKVAKIITLVHTTLGDRSFSFASSSVWNSIPNDVRCAPSLSSFKSRLKTYLFRSVYKD